MVCAPRRPLASQPLALFEGATPSPLKTGFHDQFAEDFGQDFGAPMRRIVAVPVVLTPLREVSQQ